MVVETTDFTNLQSINYISIFGERRCKTFHASNTQNFQIEIEIVVDFHILHHFHDISPNLIPTHTTVEFKCLPHPFITTNLNLSVSDSLPYRFIHGFLTSFHFLPQLHRSISTR